MISHHKVSFTSMIVTENNNLATLGARKSCNEVIIDLSMTKQVGLCLFGSKMCLG